MVAGRGAGAGLLTLLAIGAGCGASTRALGTSMDGGADAVPADAAEIDAPFVDFPEIHVPSCGNGVLDPGEACDDANRNSGDGCSQFCGLECPAADPSCAPPQARAPVCGDGLLSGGEACDDGNVASGDGCRADCSAVEAGWTCPVPGQRCFPTAATASSPLPRPASKLRGLWRDLHPAGRLLAHC